MRTYAIVLGGGSGTRMGMEINKVLMPLRDIPTIVRAIAPFSGLCAGVVVVAREDELALMQRIVERFGLGGAVHAVVAGGESRQASVANGLAALPADAQAVLIHDGARALVREDVIRRVIASVEDHGAGVAALPVTDTIKRASAEGLVLETLPRGELAAIQTPQGFRVADIRQAHALAAQDGYIATDDAALMEHAGLPVRLVQGSPENIKLTTLHDLHLAEAILAARDAEVEA